MVMSGEMDKSRSAFASMIPPMYGSPPLADTMVRMIVPLAVPAETGEPAQSTSVRVTTSPWVRKGGCCDIPDPDQSSVASPCVQIEGIGISAFGPTLTGDAETPLPSALSRFDMTVPNFVLRSTAAAVAEAACSADSSSKLNAPLLPPLPPPPLPSPPLLHPVQTIDDANTTKLSIVLRIAPSLRVGGYVIFRDANSKLVFEGSRILPWEIPLNPRQFAGKA